MKPESNRAIAEIFEEFERREEAIQKTRAKHVDHFKQNLKSRFADFRHLRDATLQSTGSSTDGTAIKRDTDFDIGIVLKFDLQAFTVKKATNQGLFKLKTNQGFFNVNNYRNEIFMQLHELMEDIHDSSTNYNFDFKNIESVVKNIHAAAFEVTMVVKNTGQTIEMDLVPQIAVDYRDLGDVHSSLSAIPEELAVAFFSLCSPPGYNYNDRNTILQVAFQLPEKYILQISGNLTKVVQLTKLLFFLNHTPIKSVYVKRAAIKLFGFKPKKHNLWKMHQSLLTNISESIKNSNGIEDYFISDHVTEMKSPNLALKVYNSKCIGPLYIMSMKKKRNAKVKNNIYV